MSSGKPSQRPIATHVTPNSAAPPRPMPTRCSDCAAEVPRPAQHLPDDDDADQRQRVGHLGPQHDARTAAPATASAARVCFQAQVQPSGRAASAAAAAGSRCRESSVLWTTSGRQQRERHGEPPARTRMPGGPRVRSAGEHVASARAVARPPSDAERCAGRGGVQPPSLHEQRLGVDVQRRMPQRPTARAARNRRGRSSSPGCRTAGRSRRRLATPRAKLASSYISGRPSWRPTSAR